VERDETKYYVLRIPYSIIEELHSRGFTEIRQPVSEQEINNTVDSVGFDFIQPPVVECDYYLQNHKASGGLATAEKTASSR